MTEPMQRPRYAEQQELLEPPPARPREEPTADA